MKPVSANLRRKHSTSGFTLVELMVASSIGLILAGTVVLLLIQAAKEQRHGFSDTTVEESAYTLQANIINVLRGSSAGLGVTLVPGTEVYSGPKIIGYNSIYVFTPNSNGTSFATSQITVNTNNGSVVYVPNVAAPASKVVWMTNRTGVVLRQLYFLNGNNLDTSKNNSLVSATFLMDDNGFSGQNLTNNIANIQRSFVVQMRCD
jgi:prepilin-type N-terminal cleavage/methylation domain-containing protein